MKSRFFVTGVCCALSVISCKPEKERPAGASGAETSTTITPPSQLLSSEPPAAPPAAEPEPLVLSPDETEPAEEVVENQKQALTESREAEVKCVWVNNHSGEGGTSPIIIRVEPNPSKRVSISTPKEFASGTGNMWEATVWLAAICASEATGHLVNDFRFSVESSGHIDGPSAGMLITAAMMALIEGDPILPDATMTGAINPDGSIGTVGGLIGKIKGANKDGISKFGYPVGCRISSPPGKEGEDSWEDLENLAAGFTSPKMESREIHNIYDAYHFLTGTSFPRPEPASEESMRLGKDLANRVRGAAKRMRGATDQRINSLQIKFSSIRDKDVRESHLSQLNHARNQIERSKRFEEESSFSLALHAAETGSYISLVNELRWELNQQLNAGGLDSYEQVIGNQALATLNYLKSLRLNMSSSMSRTTIGGKIDALHSFSKYWQGVAVMEAGRKNINLLLTAKEEMISAAKASKNSSSNDTRTKEAWAVYNEQSDKIVNRFALAHTCSESAVYWSSFTQEAGPVAANDTELFQQLGKAYSSAAGVGLAWFDAVIVESYSKTLAKRWEVSPALALERFKNILLNENHSYLPISLCATGSEYSVHLLDNSEMKPIDQLAAGIYAFHGAAGLMNDYGNYSDVDLFKGQSLGYSNRRGFSSSLDFARQRVLEKAGEFERLAGFVPDAVKLNYEFANLMRDGSDEDRLSAFKAYWKCLFFLQVGAKLHSTSQP